VGQAKTGNEAIALALKHSPDVILMDLRMPGMGVVEATKLICSERPESAVIVLTTYQGDEDIRRALAAAHDGDRRAVRQDGSRHAKPLKYSSVRGLVLGNA
jgi:DNA-binding NarL/FixJ family response regulator